jgi:hypothetical protein
VAALTSEKTPAEWNPARAGRYGASSATPRRTQKTYFSELLILVNWLLRFVPRPLTTAMMASAIPAAISPYSMAVAPDSLEKKLSKVRFNTASLDFQGGILRRHQDKARISKTVLIRGIQF